MHRKASLYQPNNTAYKSVGLLSTYILTLHLNAKHFDSPAKYMFCILRELKCAHIKLSCHTVNQVSEYVDSRLFYAARAHFYIPTHSVYLVSANTVCYCSRCGTLPFAVSHSSPLKNAKSRTRTLRR